MDWNNTGFETTEQASENISQSIQRAQSLNNLVEIMYELEASDVITEDVERVCVILRRVQEQAEKQVDIEQTSIYKLPKFLQPKTKELYKKTQNTKKSTPDDIIIG